MMLQEGVDGHLCFTGDAVGTTGRSDSAVGEPGLFYGGGFYQLGVQALGIVACGGFVFLASLAVFATLKATIGIRVKPEQELDGLDIHEHGVFGYPDLVATDYQNGNGSRQIPDPVEDTI